MASPRKSTAIPWGNELALHTVHDDTFRERAADRPNGRRHSRSDLLQIAESAEPN